MESKPAPLFPTSPANASGRVERVVLFTDMVSYSHRVSADEAATLEFMESCFDTMRILSRRHSGTLVKTMGDGALLLFEKASDAVDFGIEFHRIIEKIQQDDPSPYRFRTGLHCGTVVLRNGDVFGNTVNVAARLQAHAVPGGCVVSQAVHDSSRDMPSLEFEAIGAPELKNIGERIPLYRVIDAQVADDSATAKRNPVVTFLADDLMSDIRRSNLEPPDKAVGLLLGYLALCSGHADKGERLAELIFPDAQQAEAQVQVNSVADTLARMLSALGSRIIRNGDLIAIDPTRLDTDLELNMGMLRRNRVPNMFTQNADWPNRILAGFDIPSPMFRTWLRITRRNWRRRVLQELERLIERAGPENSVSEEAADAILLLEPGNEFASLARIEARISHGDRPAAIEEFERLERYLFETYGILPSDRIRAVIDQVIRKTSPLMSSPKRERTRRLLRIAIGKLQCPAPHAPAPALAFRAELIGSLTRFRDWAIIDTAQSAAEARRPDEELDYFVKVTALPGAVPTAVSLELTAYESGRAIWASTYAVEGDEGSALMRAIRDIVVSVEAYICADRLSPVLSGPSMLATGYDAWLRGDQALMRWTPDGAEEAMTIFKGILDKDPDNAPALYRLASVVNIQHIIWPGRPRDTKLARQAGQWAARAAELDPMDGRIQRTVAWTAAMQGQFARATMHMDLALDLNPNSPTNVASCAMGYAWFGELEKAEATLTRLRGISRYLPEWCWAYNASTLYFLNRLDPALEAAELGGHSIVDSQGWIAVIQAERGEMAAARIAFDRLFDAVQAVWAGTAPATRRAVADWFVSAFPIRNPDDRARIATVIGQASMRAERDH